MSHRTYSKKVTLAVSEYGKEKDYWLNKLSGELVKNHFPYDYHYSEVKGQKKEGTSIVGTAGIAFPDQLTARLMKISKQSDFTLHMILTAAVVQLLKIYTGFQDIMVGMPIYIQEKEGEFLNTVLVLRNQVGVHMSFKGLLLEVRKTIVEANDNLNYPIETLLYLLDISYNEGEFPLFDVVVLLENIHHKKYIEHVNPNVIFSFSRRASKLDGLLEYNTLLYRRETVHQVITYLIRLLEEAVCNVDKPLTHIEILSEEEKNRLLVDFNNTTTVYPLEKTIDELFEEQVQVRPAAVAVTYKEESLTYQELSEKTDRLASYLRLRGVRQSDVVALMAENSPCVIIGILGILKAGAAYLPLNSEYPPRRKQYLLQDGNVKILLTNLEARDCEVQEVIPLEDYNIYKHLLSFERKQRWDSLAYIMFTSGSTGTPKGVMVEHRSVVRLVKNTNFIHFRPDDRLLLTGALEFDASTFEIWGMLLNGLTLQLSNKDTILSEEKLKETIRKGRITMMWMTAPFFNQIVDSDIELFSGLETLLVGGDALSSIHINKTRKRFPRLRLINGYGPTENTTFSTTHWINQEYKENVPIGKPIANSTVYILDVQYRPQPIGAVGELFVGGHGLASGYLNNPELTHHRFIPHPFEAGERLYRTGDQARWLEDGTIQFLGRLDHQVKIRGFRIEPTEIEHHLMETRSVKEAVVIDMKTGTGEKCLCAYLVPEAEIIDTTGLRKNLSTQLPDYMVPAYFIQIDKIPLTTNGKVDRRALPIPDSASARENYMPPRNEIEKKFVEIWADVLGMKPEFIGIDTDFFELGGHSLKATILISRLHKAFHVKMPLAEIFRTPTIRELSEFVKSKQKDVFSSIESVEKREYYRLSSAQNRLYTLQQVDFKLTNYNIPAAVVMEGKLDRPRLETAFRKVIARHESLRTGFEVVNKEPVQKVHPRVEFNMEYHDLSGDQIVARETFMQNFVESFDLSRPPLLRAVVIKASAQTHILLVDMHHIITDGTSMGIFLRDLTAAYDEKELQGLRLHYKDFSFWQEKLIQKGEIKDQQQYWQKQLEGHLPVLKFSLDHPRPAIQSFEGGTLFFTVGESETGALKAIAAEEDVTSFMMYLALFNILLSRLSGQEDVIVGTPIACRRHTDLENIIGMFVNMLPLRNYPTREKNFKYFLREVKKRTLDAFESQDYQFEMLLEQLEGHRDISRNPLFDVVFVMQNMDIPLMEMSGLRLTPYENIDKISKFDLTLTGVEKEGCMMFGLEYCTKLFKKETIERFIGYFKNIISVVIENSEIPLEDIKISHELLDQKLYIPQDDRANFAF